MKILVIAGDYWHPMELIKRGIGQMGCPVLIKKQDNCSVPDSYKTRYYKKMSQ